MKPPRPRGRLFHTIVVMGTALTSTGAAAVVLCDCFIDGASQPYSTIFGNEPDGYPDIAGDDTGVDFQLDSDLQLDSQRDVADEVDADVATDAAGGGDAPDDVDGGET